VVRRPSALAAGGVAPLCALEAESHIMVVVGVRGVTTLVFSVWMVGC